MWWLKTPLPGVVEEPGRGVRAVLDGVQPGSIVVAHCVGAPNTPATAQAMAIVIPALRARGYTDQVCVQNKTVVTNAFKGEDLNHYVPVFKRYDIPVLYNFKDEDMSWVEYTPKARMRVLPKIFPEGIQVPDYFFDKNIVHLPTTKCHIYTTTTGAMKNAFGGLLNEKRHWTHPVIHETLVDLLMIQKKIHRGVFAVMDGTFAGDGPGPRCMVPHVKNVILASRDRGLMGRFGGDVDWTGHETARDHFWHRQLHIFLHEDSVGTLRHRRARKDARNRALGER